jgi:hypothetical protein
MQHGAHTTFSTRIPALSGLCSFSFGIPCKVIQEATGFERKSFSRSEPPNPGADTNRATQARRVGPNQRERTINASLSIINPPPSTTRRGQVLSSYNADSLFDLRHT